MSQQTKPLVVEVLAGMANRLRALVSAICLAEDLHRDLHVIWSANDPTCMARFETLWDRSSLPSWVKVNMGPLLESGVMIATPEEMEDYKNKNDTRPIRSYSHFHQTDMPRWLTYLRKLKPVPQLSSTPFYTEVTNLVGVHIRRGDHAEARKESPLEAFIQVMKQEPSTTKFFLATDDPNEKRSLEALFPNRILSPAITLSRFTQKGMQDAVLDFVGLSKCSKILGSYSSSFSELAALYGDTPLQVVKI